MTGRCLRGHLIGAGTIGLLFVGGMAHAQGLSVGIGTGDSLTAVSLQLIAAITVLSLAPGILIMVTCFPFIITVLAILRQGLGLQQSPPNMLLVSLALFLTFFVMEPVFQQSWRDGVQPFLNEELTLELALPRVMAPIQTFMLARTDPDTLALFAEMRANAPEPGSPESEQSVSRLVPAFMVSELSRAFQVGFLVFLPFLIIDLVVAAVLMSMGMMMVPPAIVSLPFKLAFFVVADGWALISAGLVQSYV